MKKARFWGALLVVGGILIRPESAVAGAQRAMQLWCTSVAPALFPFLALMPILTGPEACAAYNALLSRFMRPLFGLPGAAAPALAIGMLAGSPGGAIAARNAAASGLSTADARRVALCVAGVSPAYLILGVGQGLYGSAALGVRLALIQAGTQLLLLLTTRRIHYMEEMPSSKPLQEARNSAVAAAVETVLTICGYMVLFSAASAVITSFTGEGVGTALLLLADLPSGLAALSRWNIEGKFLMQGAAIGFGGLCIAAQNLDALRPLGVGKRDYFATRCAAAGMNACASGILLRLKFSEIMTFLDTTEHIYSFSLLAATFFMLPGLVFLTTSSFLNRQKSR